MTLPEVTLTGKRVILAPLRVEHAHALWPAASERDVWKYMTIDVATPPDLEQWVRDRVADAHAGTALAFVQQDAVTGMPFGSTSLFDVDLRHQRAEIGHTWVGATHRRTSANTEAKLLLFTHAFDAMGLNRVQLKTDGLNARSQRAIERLGATREGVLRAHMIVHGGRVRDTVMYSVTRDVYSVTRDEWPRVRERLERLLLQA